MKINVSFTHGCLFVPTWNKKDELVFTTSDGTVFTAVKDEHLITWYTTRDNMRFTGTEDELRHHIRSRNEGNDFIRVSFAEHGTLKYAQFVTSQQRELFLNALDQFAVLDDHGKTVFFERLDDANTALWLISQTIPFLKKTTYMPSGNNSTVLYVHDGMKEWYLSFGRTPRSNCWNTDNTDSIYIPRLKMKITVHAGIGLPWLLLKTRNREIIVSSAHELAEWTGWNVKEVTYAY